MIFRIRLLRIMLFASFVGLFLSLGLFVFVKDAQAKDSPSLSLRSGLFVPEVVPMDVVEILPGYPSNTSQRYPVAAAYTGSVQEQFAHGDAIPLPARYEADPMNMTAEFTDDFQASSKVLHLALWIALAVLVMVLPSGPRTLRE